MEGAAPGGGSRGGAGGAETGRAQVGEGEDGGGAAAPPLAPPLLRPPLPLLGILTHPAVGAWVGPRTVVAAVPVVGGVSGDGGRSRARSRDSGRGVGGVFVAFEVWRLNLSRKRQKEEKNHLVFRKQPAKEVNWTRRAETEASWRLPERLRIPPRPVCSAGEAIKEPRPLRITPPFPDGAAWRTQTLLLRHLCAPELPGLRDSVCGNQPAPMHSLHLRLPTFPLPPPPPFSHQLNGFSTFQLQHPPAWKANKARVCVCVAADMPRRCVSPLSTGR